MKATNVVAIQGQTSSQYKCVVEGCKNTFDVPYGRWGEDGGGTCSGKCERKKEASMRNSEMGFTQMQKSTN